MRPREMRCAAAEEGGEERAACVVDGGAEEYGTVGGRHGWFLLMSPFGFGVGVGTIAG